VAWPGILSSSTTRLLEEGALLPLSLLSYASTCKIMLVQTKTESIIAISKGREVPGNFCIFYLFMDVCDYMQSYYVVLLVVFETKTGY